MGSNKSKKGKNDKERSVTRTENPRASGSESDQWARGNKEK